MIFLPSKSTDLRDGHAVDMLFCECVLYILKFEMPDNRFDFLHLKLLSGSFSARSPAKRYPQGVPAKVRGLIEHELQLIEGPALFSMAVVFGTTRLIDNELVGMKE